MSTTATPRVDRPVSTADSAAVTASSPVPPHSRRRKRTRIIVALLVLIAIGYGAYRFAKSIGHESTDNAQINGQLDPVIPRVTGTVAELLADDNDQVKAGQPLLRLETHDFDVKIAGAEAALAQARANLESMRANSIVAEANVSADQVTVEQARRDFERDERLFREGSISQEAYETSRSESEAAAARHISLQRQAEAARAQIGLAEAAIAQRQSDLDYARLQRSYTTVAAPIDGVVSRRTVEPGQYVQAGQPVMAIVGAAGFWVVANFKETQLADMRPGQNVTVRLDAYPGVIYAGKVDSIAGATGARFALLPPDNATGNFVKVTQRVPVKITVADGQNPDHPLRLGLNAYAKVDVR